jgi:hypothetical protein
MKDLRRSRVPQHALPGCPRTRVPTRVPGPFYLCHTHLLHSGAEPQHLLGMGIIDASEILPYRTYGVLLLLLQLQLTTIAEGV